MFFQVFFPHILRFLNFFLALFFLFLFRWRLLLFSLRFYSLKELLSGLWKLFGKIYKRSRNERNNFWKNSAERAENLFDRPVCRQEKDRRTECGRKNQIQSDVSVGINQKKNKHQNGHGNRKQKILNKKRIFSLWKKAAQKLDNAEEKPGKKAESKKQQKIKNNLVCRRRNLGWIIIKNMLVQVF